MFLQNPIIILFISDLIKKFTKIKLSLNQNLYIKRMIERLRTILKSKLKRINLILDRNLDLNLPKI